MDITAGLEPGRLVFRRTNARAGRTVWVTPGNSPMEHLAYGRIILDAGTPAAGWETGDRETGLICLSGSACVTVDGESHALGRYDAIYIPRDARVEVSTASAADVVEVSADVERRHPVQIVRYEEVRKDPTLVFTTGGVSDRRHLNILLGRNIEAGRIVAGVTTTDPGNWASWPPHEHGAMLEEMYLYYDMPAPAFGVQFVYTDPSAPELVTVVHDGDAVLMPAGYHPNVAPPGHAISFLWAMAARREDEDRQFGVVNVQPGFDKGGSGLEAGRR
jgi:5-deoxy-glucuronate isomerase